MQIHQEELGCCIDINVQYKVCKTFVQKVFGLIRRQ